MANRSASQPRTRRGTNDYRGIEAVRGVWGAALLASPDRVLATVHGLKVDTKSRSIARILGVRHLTQALLSGYLPSPEVLAMGVWVDAVHAITALGLACADRSRTRGGLTDAAIAATWAAAGLRDLTRAVPTPEVHQRIRDRLAVGVLTRVPAGRLLLSAVRHDRSARCAT